MVKSVLIAKLYEAVYLMFPGTKAIASLYFIVPGCFASGGIALDLIDASVRSLGLFEVASCYNAVRSQKSELKNFPLSPPLLHLPSSIGRAIVFRKS
ncbi:MAG: hypothetical protein KME17_17640 [Cyanosarcina radialis HA8281-LM2]|nr:hypothetical protein [Cyanosarcina radialis HA8281-LM2]